MRRKGVILGLGIAAIIVVSSVWGAVFAAGWFSSYQDQLQNVGQKEIGKLNGFSPSETPRQIVSLVISSDGADWHASNA